MAKETYYMNQRRLRANQHIRDLAADVVLSAKEFIQPVFVDEALTKREPAKYLTGVHTETIDSLLKQTESDLSVGISKFLLFPLPAIKSNSNFSFDFANKVVESIKSNFGDSLWLAADLCLCSYTEHGHCGMLNEDQNRLLNDQTVSVLAEYALTLAQAGADCIAPSDMTDGRIGTIRKMLDTNSLDHVAIMSYAAKFHSSFYGPFRDVCKSSPSGNVRLNDRKTYQIDPSNLKDAIASAKRDICDSADIIMIKPCLPYLDVVKELSQYNVPLAVYHVSGEYAAIELLAANNLTDRKEAHLEVWTAAKRSGANMIISYAAREAKHWIA